MQPKKNSKADLSKRTLLFLQIGLILVLLTSYLIIEWKTFDRAEIEKETMSLGGLDEVDVPITILPDVIPPPVIPEPEILDIVPDDEDVIEDNIAPSEITDDPIYEPSDIEEAPTEEPIEPVPFRLIENVPVFPGCEGLNSNEERSECMSEKISQFVNKRFNTNLGNQLGLKGVNRVHVQFKIDEKGNIVETLSRAVHPKLEEEAKRVINSLPKMQPGKQRGKPVPVIYTLPIVFQVLD